MLEKIQANINDLIKAYTANPLVENQLSIAEFKEILSIFMNEDQLQYNRLRALFINPEKKKKIFTRIEQLAPGSCTFIDKSTLSKKNPQEHSSILMFSVFQSMLTSVILPRSLIIENLNDGNLQMYILLGSKLAGAYHNPFIIAKDSSIKQHGSTKLKTDVLCVSLTKAVSDQSLSVLACLKSRKNVLGNSGSIPPKSFEFGIEAEVQTMLAQYCSGILPLRLLQVDATFREQRTYTLSEPGLCLYDFLTASDPNDPSIHNSLKSQVAPLIWQQEEPIRKQIIKNITTTLCFLHEFYYVHRDIKVDNIILAEGYQAKLIDFEYICRFGTAYECSGSVDYLPMHIINLNTTQFRYKHVPHPDAYCLNIADRNKLINNMRIGHPAQDIWAFGITLFLLYTGLFLPKPSSNISKVKAYVSSQHCIEQILYAIFFPPVDNSYLTASLEEIACDQKLPLAEQKYLSMRKIYWQLYNEEFILAVDNLENLQQHVNAKMTLMV